MRMRATARLGLLSAGLFLAPSASAQSPAWMDRSLSPEQRTKLLIEAMTLDEKFQQMVGAPGIVPELPQCYGGRHVPGLTRLQIPTLRITNGPVGVGQNDCVPLPKPGQPDLTASESMMSQLSAKATALPSAIGVAASFDRNVASTFGDLLGRESLSMALQVMESPGLNMARVPQAGRNFEYFGEDPFLTGTMGVAQIRAIQKHGVIAMPKHIVANDQETDRKTVNVIIDDRVLHQIYLLPFEMAVKDGDVASVMCSYNSVNGSQMCENKHILTDILRGQWGFKGYVQSDFFAVQSLKALRAGMDHEMPGLRMTVPGYLTWFTPEGFKPALAEGEITAADIDLALTRRYLQMFRLGIFDRPVAQTPLDIAGGGAAARRIGEQTAVLLKNEGALLPLDAKTVRTIAVIGKGDFVSKSVVGGGGSSQVIPYYTVSPMEGLQKTLAELGSSAKVMLTVVADDNSNLAAAVEAARTADVTIVMAGALAEEGKDLPDLNLPHGQDAMIAAIAAANPRTALVLKDNASVLMPWIDKVPAVMEAWYPGQEDGNIVARLLLGLANPSGKTPVTYPVAAADLPANAPERFPGVPDGKMRKVEYSEGLEMGYRWFDAKAIKPLFPFGYGKSYTDFALSGFKVSRASADKKQIKVKFKIRNTGKVAGAEVAQLYLAFPKGSGEPPKRLVGFEKLWLQPGQKKQVEIILDPAASNHPFGIFDSARQSWVTPGGAYTLMLGTSSADIAFSKTVEITGSQSAAVQ
ncbi:beta-glucosidase family protein [Sphingobium boeckii]|uniref:Beta-glucosidase n=1 Tax=Sphingobium boeckii TaxID=1082345 RepID=A0A7W9EFD7_9SPHN|nr:glycoside hydrolase family 3 C-terminal domain-containing protein [Sphingobium boeckii]MBB5685940.1 beta-glucosidase [Sphingobium boeckii]